MWKNKKRLLSIVLILCLAAGGAYGGGRAILGRAGSRTVMVVQAGELNYGGWYYDESTNTYGRVTTEAVQNIYLSDALTVKEVLVQEGQEVSQGDVLLVYDETQASLALEKAQLSLEQVQLGIQVAEMNLATLQRLSPVSDGGGDDIYFPDEPEEPEEIDAAALQAEILDHLRAYTELKKDAMAFNDPATIDKLIEQEKITLGDEEKSALAKAKQEAEQAAAGEEDPLGSRRNPYRFLVENDKVIRITPEFIKALIDKAEKQYAADKTKKVADKDKAVYFLLESHEGDQVSGEGLKGKIWGRNAYQLKEETETIEVDFQQLTPTILPKKEPESEDPGTKETEPTGETEETEASETEPTESEQPGTEETESFSETESESTKMEETEQPVETESTDPKAGSEQSSSLEKNGVKTLTGSADRLLVRAVSHLRLSMPAAGDHVSFAKGDGDSSSYSSGISLISPNASYTADELKRAIKEEEESLRDLKLEEREANLTLKKAKKAKEAGMEKAAMDGVVTIAGDLSHPPTDGSPFLQVSGAAGFYVTGGLSELMLGEVAPGDPVKVLSWQTGSSYDAEITDISPYPDTSGQYGGYSSGSSASYYPFTARILDENAQLSANEYLDITIGEEDRFAAMYGDSSELYLYKAFLLEEGSSKYVYKRGENGKLVKQEVETGELRGSGWQILSGVTSDDWIAFPYGKQVKEGASCREATVMELYEAEQ